MLLNQASLRSFPSAATANGGFGGKVESKLAALSTPSKPAKTNVTPNRVVRDFAGNMGLLLGMDAS